MSDLVDSINRLDQTLQSTSTDWAQVAANTVGIVVAAIIAIVVASQQHRRQVVHEIRKEVAHIMAARYQIFLPTSFFRNNAKKGENLHHSRMSDEQFRHFEKNFEKHIDAVTETRDVLNSRFETLYLIGTPRIQIEAKVAQTALVAHALATLDVALRMKDFATGNSTDSDFTNKTTETEAALRLQLTSLQNKALVLGMNPFARASASKALN